MALAARRSIRLPGLGQYWRQPSTHDPGVLIGFVAPPRHLFPAAVDALTALLADVV